VYNKKYHLIDIESSKNNPLHTELKGKTCYLAYLNVGERGWFLCDTEEYFDPVHRIHTSVIKDVKYSHDNRITVITENTKYVFEVILSK
jgi:hypothetical protein